MLSHHHSLEPRAHPYNCVADNYYRIGMPQFKGYDVAKALRQEPWGSHIYLVALTGWGQESDRQK